MSLFSNHFEPRVSANGEIASSVVDGHSLTSQKSGQMTIDGQDVGPVEHIDLSGEQGVNILRGAFSHLVPLTADEEFEMMATMRTFDCIQIGQLSYTPMVFRGEWPGHRDVVRTMALIGGSITITRDSGDQVPGPGRDTKIVRDGLVFLPRHIPSWVLNTEGLEALIVDFHASRLAPVVDLPSEVMTLNLEADIAEIITLSIGGVAASPAGTDEEGLRTFVENRLIEAFILHGGAVAEDELSRTCLKALEYVADHFAEAIVNPVSVAKGIGVPEGRLRRAFKDVVE